MSYELGLEGWVSDNSMIGQLKTLFSLQEISRLYGVRLHKKLTTSVISSELFAIKISYCFLLKPSSQIFHGNHRFCLLEESDFWLHL